MRDKKKGLWLGLGLAVGLATRLIAPKQDNVRPVTKQNLVPVSRKTVKHMAALIRKPKKYMHSCVFHIFEEVAMRQIFLLAELGRKLSL